MHKTCRMYAWAYELCTRMPWDNPWAPGAGPTRWALLVDWLSLMVCEACDEEIFGT